MDAQEYISQLQMAADIAKANGDEGAPRRQAIADFSSMIFQQCNGQALEAVFFAMPLMVEVIHSTLDAYDSPEEQEPLSQQEIDYLLAVKQGIVECVAHLNHLTAKPPVAPKPKPKPKNLRHISDMTDEEIAEELRKLNVNDKDDA